MTRLDWPPILERADEIVRGYQIPVTLRQLFYRLVAEGELPNSTSAYNRLGRLSAQGRREGWFPRLYDQGRAIDRPLSFTGPDDARAWLLDRYRRDRTEGQPYALYLGTEKATLHGLLGDWFSDLGVPMLVLRGYSGQELVTDAANDIMVSSGGRPAVLLYAGDFDPSGEDIQRDFIQRVGGFSKVIRVALDDQQVTQLNLPPQVGKTTDPRASDFVAKHGRLVQVELEALDPNDLRQLYQTAVDQFWDDVTYRKVLRRERADKARLQR
jgi:hypothetical protein